MTTRKRKPVAATRRIVRPQVVLEVHSRGLLKWELTINGIVVGSGFNKDEITHVARTIKNSIAKSGGRAELVIKNRKGQIDKGPQGRDSAGPDPRESRG